MESDSSLSTVALLLSLLLFALASVAETGIASVGRERAKELASQGVPGAGLLVSLHLCPAGATTPLAAAKFLALAASLLSVTALVVATLGLHWGYVSLTALGLIGLLGAAHGLFRMLAGRYGEATALRMAPLAWLLGWILGPFFTLYAAVGRRTLPGAQASGPPGSEAAVSHLVQAILPGESPERFLDEREAKMIRAILQMEKTIAREIMIPRVDIVAAEVGTRISVLAELMIEGGHSRTPVYEETIDNIVGIVHARDVVRLLNRQDEIGDLRDIARPVVFIPESKRLEDLLREFQERRVQIAIVVDEYGGVSGLVTVEDLLEEIVGELEDEFDVGEPEVEAIVDDMAIMDARISIDRLNELFSVNVEGEGFDTLGGFVYQQLGKMPSPGDRVEYDGLVIQVLSTLGRRIKKVKVMKTGPTIEEAI